MAIRKCEICGREQSAEISESCCECRFPIYVSDKDPKIRVWHYREASERGYKNAQYNLGMCYEAGIGIPKDYVEAARWFRKAAEQGHPTAQYKLGEYYRYGIVFQKDYVEAARWYRKAAEQGYEKAEQELENLEKTKTTSREVLMNYYQMLGIKEDASPDEIKTAYKNNIKVFHPYYYKGSDTDFAEEKTKELYEAYRVLKDPNKRAEYDYYLQKESRTVHPRSASEKRKTTSTVTNKSENYARGLLGAFLYALGGGVIWGVVYYQGYLHSYCGIITILLAIRGYKKFGHIDYLDTSRKIICLVITVIVSALAIYLSLSASAYFVLREQYIAGELSYGPSFFEVCTIYIPYVLQTDPETLSVCLLDLGKGLGLSAISLIIMFFTEK